jgi:LPXTG-site transpeptidase (sortase) family protein
VVDPAVTKFGDVTKAEIGDTVVYTLKVFNNGIINATNVVVVDTKPAFLDIVSVTVVPAGPSVSVSGNTVTINIGTVGPADLFVITIETVVNNSGKAPGGRNRVALTAAVDDDLTNNNAAVLLTIPKIRPTILPETGFPPRQITDLSAQPEDLQYFALGDLWLDVPKLKLAMDIVGVPVNEEGWDVSWLWNDAGYLEGTTFPTRIGNTGIAGHAVLANGLPGPFAKLGTLAWGDEIVVHAWGHRYIYQVREVLQVDPEDLAVLGDEEYSWITLVTCKFYDPTTGDYSKRIIVRAVLLDVEQDVAFTE